ncbi:MAG: cytochrome c3 family protein [Thermodesulfobacteriota bacterium]
MNKQSVILCIGIVIAALTIVSGGHSPAAPAPAEATAEGSPNDACLECHGPFEAIVSETADYMMESGGEKIKSNPHRYVPHASTDIPECSHCHRPHPVPPAAPEGLPKPDAEWCYTCHHTRDLKCGGCHEYSKDSGKI